MVKLKVNQFLKQLKGKHKQLSKNLSRKKHILVYPSKVLVPEENFLELSVIQNL